MMNPAPLRSAALSDPGIIRGNNEDRVYADDERGIYIVIDGVGGEAAGERAAAIAEEEIVARLARATGAIEDRIREGIAVAGKRILEQSRRNPELDGMACVLTVAVVSDGEVVVGHVGDTRLYKIRRGAIEKITRDHSPVGVREDAGEMSERAAMQHPRRNEIFRDVGSEEHAPGDAGFIDVKTVPFEPDAALLLCSDGLTDQVTSAEVLGTVERGAGDPSRVARELIQLANDAGGKDNVSVVYIEGPHAGQPAPAVDPPRRSSRPLVLAGILIAGVALGAAAAALARQYFSQEPPPERRILTVESSGIAVAPDSFTTIADALAAARPGDIIEVRPGTYREQVEMKEGIRLVSVAPGEAVLEPAADASRPGAAVVFRNVTAGSLSGFRIVIPEGAGVSIGVLVSDSNVDLGGLDVQGAAAAGILVRGASKPVIHGARIHHNAGAGIVVQDGAAPRLLSNIITHNGSSREAPRAGLEVADGADPAVEGNAFSDNYKNVVWAGAPRREIELAKTNVMVAPPRRPRAPAAPARHGDQ